VNQTATCTCEKHDDGSRTWARVCPDHGEAAIKRRMVPVGTRIRSIQHPELTGKIKGLEWTRPGELSPLPYLIGWDNSSRAADVLGMFFVYGSPDSVERPPETAAPIAPLRQRD
jgi:hypothetical protein